MSQNVIPTWVIGNWKMNPNNVHQLSVELCQLALQNSTVFEHCQVAIAPTNLHLLLAKEQLAQTSIHVFSQDVSRFAKVGAFTGEVSADLLIEQGICATLIGHSERRDYFSETTEILQTKIKNALMAKMKIIYCVGESLIQRESGQAEQVVLQQICDLAQAIEQDEDWKNILIAYEPIWAIGTGKTASKADAQAMHLVIRQGLMQITAHAMQMPILYGGSVKADNALEFAQCPDINGALVGGASLEATSFFDIIKAFAHKN